MLPAALGGPAGVAATDAVHHGGVLGHGVGHHRQGGERWKFWWFQACFREVYVYVVVSVPPDAFCGTVMCFM